MVKFNGIIIFLLSLPFFVSPSIAQVGERDLVVERCAVIIGARIDGEMRGKISDAYQEGNIIGDEFVFERFSLLFDGANPSERIELYRLFIDCIRSPGSIGGLNQSNREKLEPTEDEMYKAHLSAVSPFALSMFPIRSFDKIGCTIKSEDSYRCSYAIVTGNSSRANEYTMTYKKDGAIWVIENN